MISMNVIRGLNQQTHDDIIHFLGQFSRLELLELRNELLEFRVVRSPERLVYANVFECLEEILERRVAKEVNVV